MLNLLNPVTKKTIWELTNNSSDISDLEKNLNVLMHIHAPFNEKVHRTQNTSD